MRWWRQRRRRRNKRFTRISERNGCFFLFAPPFASRGSKGVFRLGSRPEGIQVLTGHRRGSIATRGPSSFVRRRWPVDFYSTALGINLKKKKDNQRKRGKKMVVLVVHVLLLLFMFPKHFLVAGRKEVKYFAPVLYARPSEAFLVQHLLLRCPLSSMAAPEET